jgi:hypothetical protein
VFVGAGAVEKVSPVFGAEAGMRTTRNLDLIVEGGKIGNAVTRRRVQSVEPLANYLKTTQGKDATATVEAPTWFGAVGARWVFERAGAIRPYVLGTVGFASVEYKTSFTLAGSDITDTVANYGVTVGQDLKGREKVATYGMGVGALYVRGAWYADAGLRLTSIQTKGQATNVSRAAIGFGLRF